MTTTQEEEVGGARSNDGTAAGMIAWLGWTIDRGELPSATASALRTGCQKVLVAEEDLAGVDMRSADLDAIVNRFRNKSRGGDMKDSTVAAYEQRFRQSADMYRKWLEGDEGWRPATRNRSTSAGPAKKVPVKKAVAPNIPVQQTVVEERGDTTPKLIEYPFPIRPGLRGKISLPEDLTAREAKRIANFVASLAFDDDEPEARPLEITSGRNSA